MEKWYVLDALETLNSLLSVFTSRRKLNDLFKKRNLETKMVKKKFKATQSHSLGKDVRGPSMAFPIQLRVYQLLLAHL